MKKQAKNPDKRKLLLNFGIFCFLPGVPKKHLLVRRLASPLTVFFLGHPVLVRNYLPKHFLGLQVLKLTEYNYQTIKERLDFCMFQSSKTQFTIQYRTSFLLTLQLTFRNERTCCKIIFLCNNQKLLLIVNFLNQKEKELF